jgi:hypothetical protein
VHGRLNYLPTNSCTFSTLLLCVCSKLTKVNNTRPVCIKFQLRRLDNILRVPHCFKLLKQLPEAVFGKCQTIILLQMCLNFSHKNVRLIHIHKCYISIASLSNRCCIKHNNGNNDTNDKRTTLDVRWLSRHDHCHQRRSIIRKFPHPMCTSMANLHK